VAAVDRLVTVDELAEVVGGEVHVELDAALLLERLERLLEVVVGHAHDDVAEHVDEPAVGVVGEALVAGGSGRARSATVSLIPRLRTVSIIPGIETAAPLRTERRSGRSASPNCRSMARSRWRMAPSTSSSSPAGQAPWARTWAQASVEIVKPGGTGSPILLISARLAPLPPSRAFMVRSPSAVPFPKRYT
jgi:hypothetical protein